MRGCDQPALTMTHLSVKVGRVTAGPRIGDAAATVFGGRFRCDVDDYVIGRRDGEEDGAAHPSRTRSSSDLRGYFDISRKFSLPDFPVRGFRCADPDLDPLEVEMMMDGEGEPGGGDPSGTPWLDFYNRTPCVYEDDRILNLFNRVVRPRDSETSPDGKGLGGGGGGGGAEKVENLGVQSSPPLPWRTKEVLLALEDGSKYLREDTEFLSDEATPQIRIDGSGSNHHYHHHQDHHPLASFHQSSSSRSGSFRKIPSFDSVPRPDLSAGHSFSLSHWLSEAESRHSEPFCLPHHHLEPTSAAGGGHRTVPPPIQGHGLHQRSCCRTDRRQSGSSGSSSESSFIPDDGEALDQPGHRDQVLRWLLANDLEATAVLDESDDRRSLDSTSGQFDI